MDSGGVFLLKDLGWAPKKKCIGVDNYNLNNNKMFYYKKIKINKKESLSKEYLMIGKMSFFEISEKKHVYLYRKNIIPSRGIFRIIFPRLVTKLIEKPECFLYKIKLDWFASIFFFVFLAVSIGEFFIDRNKYPTEYPWFFPFIMLGWYFVAISFETAITVKRLKEDVF